MIINCQYGWRAFQSKDMKELRFCSISEIAFTVIMKVNITSEIIKLIGVIPNVKYKGELNYSSIFVYSV